MKKILMSIGSVAAVVTPIVATISCGGNTGKSSGNFGDNSKFSDFWSGKDQEIKFSDFWSGKDQEIKKIPSPWGTLKYEGKGQRSKIISLKDFLDEIDKVKVYKNATEIHDKESIIDRLNERKRGKKIDRTTNNEQLENTFVRVQIMDIQDCKYEWQMTEKEIKDFQKQAMKEEIDVDYEKASRGISDTWISLYKYKGSFFDEASRITRVLETVEDQEELQKSNKLFKNLRQGKMIKENISLIKEIYEIKNKKMIKTTLKQNAKLYGYDVEYVDRYGYSFKVIDRINSAGKEPKKGDLLELFEFEGKGDIFLDERLGTYKEQMRRFGRATYIVTDKITNGQKNRIELSLEKNPLHKITLKERAKLYGNKVKDDWGYFEVTNSIDRLGKEPQKRKIKNLFNFSWVGGGVELDKSLGTFADQIKKHGYASYIVTDKLLQSGLKKEKLLRFYPVKPEIKFKYGSTKLYGNEVKTHWDQNFEVTNSVDRLDKKPNTEDIKELFDFVGVGSVAFDKTIGDYSKHMEWNDFARYIITAKLSDGTTQEKTLRFFACNPEIKLKDDANLYGNKVMKFNLNFGVINSAADSLGKKPNTEDIKALFEFVGKGSVKLDESLGTFEKQMEIDGYASYIVKDELSNGRKQIRVLRFYEEDNSF